VIQFGGIKRNVFMKFFNDTYVQNNRHFTNGSVEYRHTTGEILIVCLEVAGMGMRLIRLTNLPPEVTERNISAALASYGEIVSIQDELCSKTCSYKVANGDKVMTMKLAKHHPSQMNVAGRRATPSCDGQPVTSYGCGDSRHINQAWPRRHGGDMGTSDSTPIHGHMSTLKAPKNDSAMMTID